MFAHVDCNNFYVSCERVFNPKLCGKPVIVLSNNDGCAVAGVDDPARDGLGSGGCGKQEDGKRQRNNGCPRLAEYGRRGMKRKKAPAHRSLPLPRGVGSISNM